MAQHLHRCFSKETNISTHRDTSDDESLPIPANGRLASRSINGAQSTFSRETHGSAVNPEVPQQQNRYLYHRHNYPPPRDFGGRQIRVPQNPLVSLHRQIRGCRVEAYKQPSRHFVPRCRQDALLTVDAIANDIIKGDGMIEMHQAKRCAEETRKVAKSIYATLACIDRGADMCQLVDQGISDKELPLKYDKLNIELRTSSGRLVQGLEHWDEEIMEDFYERQWWMTAPVFKNKKHFDLNEREVLPFIPLGDNDGMTEPKQGAYSEVFAVHVHPSHHDFWVSDSPQSKKALVAVKKLFSFDRTEFQKEVDILTILDTKKPHKHLIRLLATYRQNGAFHLLFPYADFNLRSYWDSRPTPAFDDVTVMWSVKQMAGIANALSRLHNFKVTIPLDVSGAGKGAANVRVQDDGQMSVIDGEEKYGRHGDIKPENILWFKEGPEADDPQGALKLADFGLGRFHGRDSKSGIRPSGIRSSPTYEPPECRLRRPVSRAYDIWSCGCVWLEFITWLLKGTAALDEFAECRSKSNTAQHGTIDDDYFFTIQEDADRFPEANIRLGVTQWVDELHRDEKCSKLIHDLLDLTMNNLLLTDSNQRAKAGQFNRDMDHYSKASADKDYMLKPVPWPAKSPDPAPPRTHNEKSDSDVSCNDLTTMNVSENASISRESGGTSLKPKKTVTWPADLATGDIDYVHGS
ncbi:hypothetical protein EAF04_004019 [Stromatinia cepivora]|nr:hypothetical protein EAF04_004019 [Stromatinia cepivora]